MSEPEAAAGVLKALEEVILPKSFLVGRVLFTGCPQERKCLHHVVLHMDEEKIILKSTKLVALFRKMDNKHLPNDQKRERVYPISQSQ